MKQDLALGEYGLTWTRGRDPTRPGSLLSGWIDPADFGHTDACFPGRVVLTTVVMEDLVTKPKDDKGISRLAKIWLVWGLIAFLWSGSLVMVFASLRLGVPAGAELPSLGDMATLLFGASSVALIIFSLLIGGIAIAGYQTLKEGVKKDIEVSMRERINELERELRGRVIAAIGLMSGTLYSKPEQLVQSEEDKDYLSEAVQYCDDAYRILKTLPGNVQYMALNNRAYYSCLLKGGDKVRDPLFEGALLQDALELKKIGRDKNFTEALLTYCRVILQFGTDPGEIQEAYDIAKVLQVRELTPRQKKEVTFYVTHLAKKLPKPEPKSN